MYTHLKASRGLEARRCIDGAGELVLVEHSYMCFRYVMIEWALVTVTSSVCLRETSQTSCALTHLDGLYGACNGEVLVVTFFFYSSCSCVVDTYRNSDSPANLTYLLTLFNLAMISRLKLTIK